MMVAQHCYVTFKNIIPNEKLYGWSYLNMCTTHRIYQFKMDIDVQIVRTTKSKEIKSILMKK